MVLSRAATLPKGLARTVIRRAGSGTRNRSWRQVGRRGYASEHGHQQSSEIPWIIGSLAVTVPAAGWLLQQGPKTGDHGHGHEAHEEEHEEKEEGEEEQSQGDESKEEESQDESKDEGDSKEEDKSKDGDDGKDEQKDKDGDDQDDESKSDDSGSKDKPDSKSDAQMSEDGYELPSPNAPQQINWHSGMSKGPGEGQKGERKPTERKGEKDAQGEYSGAKHPYLDDPEKSKKGVGVTETARIHGTVDPSKGARGAGATGQSSS